MSEPSETPSPATARSAEGALTERTALETAGLVLGVLGGTAILFGGALYALDPGVLPLSVGNAAFGVFALAFYGATNRRSFARALAGRSTSFVLLEVFIGAGVIAAAATINFFAAESRREWDLTREHLYSLSEHSIEVARKLDAPVRVLGFFRSTEPGREVLKEAMALYQMHTPHLQVEFINPDAPPPGVVAKYDMSSRSPRIVIASETGRYTKVRTPTEESITNALYQVAEKPPRRVYFLTGHGEPSAEDNRSDEGYATIAGHLRDAGFEVATLSLLDKDSVPGDATVLVYAGASKPLFPHEAASIEAWLDKGGRALFLLEPGVRYDLDGLFGAYGIVLGDDLVIEGNRAAIAQGFGPEAPVVQRFEPHAITNKLTGQAALFFRARSVTPKVGLARLTVTTLAQTGPMSFGETAYQSGEAARDENDVPGPVPIAAAVTRNTAASAGKITDEARLAVFGDAHFAQNRFAPMGAHVDLALNVVSWLAGDEDRITIRPRRRSPARLPLTEWQQYGIMFFSVNLLPLVIVGFGLSVWAVRRRK